MFERSRDSNFVARRDHSDAAAPTQPVCARHHTHSVMTSPSIEVGEEFEKAIVPCVQLSSKTRELTLERIELRSRGRVRFESVRCERHDYNMLNKISG